MPLCAATSPMMRGPYASFSQAASYPRAYTVCASCCCASATQSYPQQVLWARPRVPILLKHLLRSERVAREALATPVVVVLLLPLTLDVALSAKRTICMPSSLMKIRRGASLLRVHLRRLARILFFSRASSVAVLESKMSFRETMSVLANAWILNTVFRNPSLFSQ